LKKDRCPYCGVEVSTLSRKIDLLDTRYKHRCKNCGNRISLPTWYLILNIFQTIIAAVIGVLIIKNLQIELNKWLIIVMEALIMFPLWFIQLRYIPVIKKDE
jgi:undecaprenyl pyrophosphate phosphatase UppP